MNVWHITGNLGKDCEVKYTPQGTPVAEFSVAVKSGYGEREKTNWVRCAMFGKKAEGNLPQYLLKGTQVAISGELEMQEWDGANGKGAALALKVDNIDLIGGKPQGQQQAYNQSQVQPQPTYQQPPQQAPQMAPQQPQQAPQNNGYAQAQQQPMQGNPQYPK